jgi:hypothetical protein
MGDGVGVPVIVVVDKPQCFMCSCEVKPTDRGYATVTLHHWSSRFTFPVCGLCEAEQIRQIQQKRRWIVKDEGEGESSS